MNHILFWPGRNAPVEVLSEFRNRISAGNKLDVFPFSYDEGDIPFDNGSQWVNWLSERKYDWWCGLSLGASMACYIYTFLKIGKPNRLTLINPFVSRSLLASENGFSMDGQWDFNIKNRIVKVEKADIVISLHDDKIGIKHGITIANSIDAKEKEIVFIDDDHEIKKTIVQAELGDYLNKCESTEETLEYEQLKYCHVYQSGRKL